MPSLIAYITHLHKSGKKPATITSYLAALGTYQKLLFDVDPTKSFLINRSLKGLRKISLSSPGLLPIRFQLLANMLQELHHLNLDLFLRILSKAIFLLAYHGCFRIGELVWSQSLKHTLTISCVNLTHAPKAIEITLPSFKHSVDPVEIVLPATHTIHCPFNALKDYLTIRPRVMGPLFVSAKGQPVKRELVAKVMKMALSPLVHDTSRFNTHSFRIGRTTDLASVGTPDSVIRETGRWRSDAFKAYIKPKAVTLPEPPSV